MTLSPRFFLDEASRTWTLGAVAGEGRERAQLGGQHGPAVRLRRAPRAQAASLSLWKQEPPLPTESSRPWLPAPPCTSVLSGPGPRGASACGSHFKAGHLAPGSRLTGRLPPSNPSVSPKTLRPPFKPCFLPKTIY